MHTGSAILICDMHCRFLQALPGGGDGRDTSMSLVTSMYKGFDEGEQYIKCAREDFPLLEQPSFKFHLLHTLRSARG